MRRMRGRREADLRKQFGDANAKATSTKEASEKVREEKQRRCNLEAKMVKGIQQSDMPSGSQAGWRRETADPSRQQRKSVLHGLEGIGPMSGLGKK